MRSWENMQASGSGQPLGKTMFLITRYQKCKAHGHNSLTRHSGHCYRQ
jgi:hypothetical protein